MELHITDVFVNDIAHFYENVKDNIMPPLYVPRFFAPQIDKIRRGFYNGKKVKKQY